jgi:hypothetical protein
VTEDDERGDTLIKDGVNAALDLILEEITAVERQLASEVITSMQAKSFDEADAIIGSAKQLQAFREKLEQLRDEWQVNIDAETRQRVNVTSSATPPAQWKPSIVGSTEPQRSSYRINPHPKQPATGLSVTTSDGRYIHCTTAAETFVRALESAGVERVRALGLRLNHLPLINTVPDTNYQQARSGKYLIGTHCNTAKKKEMLDDIGRRLHLDWKVTIL